MCAYIQIHSSIPSLYYTLPHKLHALSMYVRTYVYMCIYVHPKDYTAR